MVSSLAMGSMPSGLGVPRIGDQLAVAGERAIDGRGRLARDLAPERRAERGQRDLELGVVGLGRGDLLHEEAWPEERSQGPRRAIAGEDALDLVRDGGD